jgi:CxxC-x17-CxxC domain-containing protein
MGSFGRDNRGGGGRNFGRRSFGDGGRSFGGSNFGRDSGRREMFSAACSNCGKECQIPFRPTSGKPVYCSDCFEKMNAGRPDSRRPGRSEFRASIPSFDQSKSQFDAINAKLDKILGILSPAAAPIIKEVADEIPEPVKKDEKVGSVKAKKVIKKATSIVEE